MKITLTIPLCLLAIMPIFAQNYCTPQTQAYCCGYGIISVSLPNLNNSSVDASEGYRDFTAQLSSGTEGTPFTISIGTGGVEPHDVRAWLDANNDGIFSHPQEMVFESLNAQSPSGNLSIPLGTLFNTNLRLRITADFAGSNPQPCTNPTFGQTEDYSLLIVPAGELPTANFTASTTNSCNGVILFSSQSTGSPATYLWDFGDGHTATQPMYTHTYSEDGVYSVGLTVANSLGADTLVMENYVTVSLSETCDTFSLQQNSNYSVLYSCNHVITDDGISANYSDNTDAYISLSPIFAEQVCIRFSEFHYEQEFDYIEIFDGPTPASSLLGKYTGTELPPDICSTGPALCIKQHSDDVVNYAGFTAQANCTLDISENITTDLLNIYPNPFSGQLNIALPAGHSNPWKISILSVTGQVLYSNVFSNINSSSISLSYLPIPAGIYTLLLASGNTSWQQKIIKLQQ